MHEPLDATLRRLEQERAEADRRYNDALTAFDRALRPPGALPPAPPDYDEQQIPALNEAWNILPAPPAGAGVTRRLTGFVWRTVAAFFERQLTFNSRLVDHLNRNVRMRTATRTEHRCGDRRPACAHRPPGRQSKPPWSRCSSGSRRSSTPSRRADAQTLNAAVSAMGDTLGQADGNRWRSRERASPRAPQVGVAQQAALTVKRELERSLHDRCRRPRGRRRRACRRQPRASRRGSTPTSTSGSRIGSAARATPSAPGRKAICRSSRGAPAILDVGCGRGEFLDLLASRGMVARGIDTQPRDGRGMPGARTRRRRRRRGRLPRPRSRTARLGGLFSAQVVEHLQPSYLLRFLELAFHKLAPGGLLVLETLNPACWVAFFDSYIRDITHVWPLHPDTLKYLVTASGFPDVEVAVPRAGAGRAQAAAVDAGCELGSPAARCRAHVQRQHGQAERADLQLPRLCRRSHALAGR